MVWQWNEGMPRLAFGKGISSLAKLQGHERTGVVLVLFLILIMDYWSHHYSPRNKVGTVKPLGNGKPGSLVDGLGHDRLGTMVKSLYLMTCYEAYMKCRSVPFNSLENVKKFIPFFMDQVHRGFPRKEGNEENTVKMHFPGHLIDDMKRHGSAANFNSGPGESLHKHTVKEPGKRTNFHRDTFQNQAACRYTENLAIQRAWQDMPEFLRTYKKEKSPQEDEEAATYHCKILEVSRETVKDGCEKKMHELPNWKESALDCTDLVQLIRQRILPLCKSREASISVTTKTVRNGQKFFAQPSFGASGRAQQEWAILDFVEGGECACQLLCFIELKETLKEAVHVGGNTHIMEEGHYALIHCASAKLSEDGDPYNYGGWSSGTLAHPDQKIVHCVEKQKDEDGSNTLMAVPCDSIERKCISLPLLRGTEVWPGKHLVLRNTTEWAEVFQEHAIQHSKK